eukprot:scaffold615435_cov18-Prasinocladus_malaysianus.AAC.1
MSCWRNKPRATLTPWLASPRQAVGRLSRLEAEDGRLADVLPASVNDPASTTSDSRIYHIELPAIQGTMALTTSI